MGTTKTDLSNVIAVKKKSNEEKMNLLKKCFEKTQNRV